MKQEFSFSGARPKFSTSTAPYTTRWVERLRVATAELNLLLQDDERSCKKLAAVVRARSRKSESCPTTTLFNLFRYRCNDFPGSGDGPRPGIDRYGSSDLVTAKASAKSNSRGGRRQVR